MRRNGQVFDDERGRKDPEGNPPRARGDLNAFSISALTKGWTAAESRKRTKNAPDREKRKGDEAEDAETGNASAFHPFTHGLQLSAFSIQHSSLSPKLTADR